MAIPSQERTTGNYGYAPYQESAFKAALRLLGQGFGAGVSGLSAVPQGANFGEAFLASAGASGKAVSAARMAAEEYAMKRQEAERKAQEDEVQSRYMEALTKQAERPPKPEKPEKIEPWNLTPEEQERYYRHLEAVERSKARGKPAKTGKPPAAPKVPKPRAGVQKILDLISTANVYDPAHRAKLQEWLANPISPEVAAAAAAKLTVPGTGGAMRR